MTVPALDEWLRAVLRPLREEQFPRSSIRNVTLLAYFFWDDERIETKFYTVECAFLCAFHCFGLMPSVLAVNRKTPRIVEFCNRYGIELQVDATLTGGVPRMNIDCICNAHKRFKTDYVLIIQSDGIPVNPGLEAFVGLYDYFGAPWSGHTHHMDWFPYPRFAVGNGGLTLRSRRICEAAERAYAAFWRHLPYNWLVGDDVFFCKTMPFFSGKWRATFRIAPPELAARFAIEHAHRWIPEDRPPMGFHAPYGFGEYVKRYGMPLREMFEEGMKCSSR